GSLDYQNWIKIFNPDSIGSDCCYFSQVWLIVRQVATGKQQNFRQQQKYLGIVKWVYIVIR
ncbi:MAG: hypothetical protein ACYTXY_33860, partial [Nostoc sp.]